MEKDRVDPSTRARLAAKDMLRGLRHELDRLKSERPVTRGLPSGPAEALQSLFEAVDKIASAGEDFARDLLLTKRDQSRYSDFFDPRAALAGDPEASHRFIRSRYAALKLVASALSDAPALISESKIAAAFSSLSPDIDHEASVFEAHFAFALAHEQPITLPQSGKGSQASLNRRAALIVGLAGTVAAHGYEHAAQDLPELIALCRDVVTLRQSVFEAIMEGFDPLTALAAELKLLAPHLAEP